MLLGDRAGLKMLYSTAPRRRSAGSEAIRMRISTFGSDSKREASIWIFCKIAHPGRVFRSFGFRLKFSRKVPRKPKNFFVSEGQVWQQQGGEWRLVVVQRTNAAHLNSWLNNDKRKTICILCTLMRALRSKKRKKNLRKEQQCVSRWSFSQLVLRLSRPRSGVSTAGFRGGYGGL